MTGQRPLVGISGCGDYAAAEVGEALARALTPLGGMGAFVSQGDRVFLKVNLLSRAGPDRAVTTHPDFVRAVIRAAFAAGAGDVAVGDSPAGRSTANSVRSLFDTCGMTAVCAEEGARLVLLDDEVKRVPVEGQRLYASFNLGREAVEADVLISLPKLKTHGFMMYTGGVKNLFGCVPGLEKAQFHLKVPDRDDFADMLIDLMLACHPDLTIMDAVVGMEGEGPAGGTPRRIGAILASADPVSLDVVASSMVGFDPMDVYTNKAAARRGLGPQRIEDVDVAGEPWQTFALRDFARPMRDVSGRLPVALAKWLRRRTASLPLLADPVGCSGCRTCEQNCPVSAINMVEGRPVFDYDGCIRCYCCQETCQQQVIALKAPLMVRLLFPRAGGRRA